MNIIRNPKVYLVGKQTMVDADVQEFLDDHDIGNWHTDTDVAGEELIEVAGRLCYMSFAKPRPGGNAAYIGHIKEVGHGSVVEHAVFNFIVTGVSRSFSHELVRHRAGWAYSLAGDTVIYGDHKCNGRRQGVGTRTIKDIFNMTKTPHGRSRLKLLRLRCYDGSEFTRTRVAGVSESGVKDIVKVTLEGGESIRCSMDHRFLTPTGWRSVRNLAVGVPLASNGLPATGLQKEWLEQKYHHEGKMLTEIASEAGCSPHTVRKWIRRYGLQKSQGQGMTGRKPWNKGICYRAGWRHTEETKQLLSDQKKGTSNSRWKGNKASSHAARLRALKAHPAQPCESCGIVEGHRHHVDRNVYNNDAANIQFLCASCHQKLHIAEDHTGNWLRVRWQKIVSIVLDGREMTYDLEVHHPCHNFIANGFVTHNSQLSQRYVDESVADFVEPDVIARDPGLHERWLDAIEQCQDVYKDLVENLSRTLAEEAYCKAEDVSTCDTLAAQAWLKTQPAEKRTELRKAARQAARSVLPNATETKIFVTVNARALRHFIEMRASRFAEPEIRKVAVAMLHIAQTEAPNLFDDYELVQLPDGTFEAQTKYRKI